MKFPSYGLLLFCLGGIIAVLPVRAQSPNQRATTDQSPFFIRVYGSGLGGSWSQFGQLRQSYNLYDRQMGGGLGYGLQLLPFFYLEGGPQYSYHYRSQQSQVYRQKELHTEIQMQQQTHRVRLPVQLFVRGTRRLKPLFGLGCYLVDWRATSENIQWIYHHNQTEMSATNQYRGRLQLAEPTLLSTLGLEYQWRTAWSVRLDAQVATQWFRYENLRWSIWEPRWNLGLVRNW